MTVTSVATYHIGDLRRLTAAFSVGGVATDPTTLSFTMRAPDGTVTTYVYASDAELVRDSAGAFHVDWPVAQAGRHSYRFAGTGAAQEAGEGEFFALRKETGA